MRTRVLFACCISMHHVRHTRDTRLRLALPLFALCNYTHVRGQLPLSIYGTTTPELRGWRPSAHAKKGCPQLSTFPTFCVYFAQGASTPVNAATRKRHPLRVYAKTTND